MAEGFWSGARSDIVIKTAVIIPFRDRGIDPLRRMNLDHVLEQWDDYGFEWLVTSDGREDGEQFNRSAAYNQGVKHYGDAADVFVFAESDMLIDAEQIRKAVFTAACVHGLVVPFTEYRYLSNEDSATVRNGGDPAVCRPQYVMGGDRKSIGAINVVSRETMNLVGQWDEGFEGNWYDDDAMKIAFEVCAGPTQFIDGPAYHLYHLPGHRGSHLTKDDRAATLRNKGRLELYRRNPTPELIRKLTGGKL